MLTEKAESEKREQMSSGVLFFLAEMFATVRGIIDYYAGEIFRFFVSFVVLGKQCSVNDDLFTGVVKLNRTLMFPVFPL